MKGKYSHTMLIASAAVGDNGTIPIAYAVVESESESSWAWFLANLLSYLCNDTFRMEVRLRDDHYFTPNGPILISNALMLAGYNI